MQDYSDLPNAAFPWLALPKVGNREVPLQRASFPEFLPSEHISARNCVEIS